MRALRPKPGRPEPEDPDRKALREGDDHDEVDGSTGDMMMSRALDARSARSARGARSLQRYQEPQGLAGASGFYNSIIV